MTKKEKINLKVMSREKAKINLRVMFKLFWYCIFTCRNRKLHACHQYLK